jgi:porin
MGIANQGDACCALFLFEKRAWREVMKNLRISSVALLLLLVAASGYSQEDSLEGERMDGMDSWLHQFGIRLESSYKGEFWANARGGLKQQQTHLHNIDIAASLDTKRAGLWNNGTLFVHALSNPGGKLLTEEIVGDSQTVSNIEAPHSTRLYEFWYEHSFIEGRLSLLAGIHDLNTEFAASEHGALFLNSSFGITKDISGGGRPSIFPLAAPAIQARYVLNSAWEFKLGVYNGDPGDPGVYRHFPKLTFNSKAGAYISFETAYRFSPETSPGSVKVGYWRNTGRFEDLLDVDAVGNPISHKGNEGFYLVADKMIFMNDGNRGLGAFIQLGSAPNGNINEFRSYIGGGVKYIGLIPHRRADEMGIAVAHARVSDKLLGNRGRDKSETTLEVTYRMAINKRLAIQPDIQLILNPGTNSEQRNAIVGGVRFDVSF